MNKRIPKFSSLEKNNRFNSKIVFNNIVKPSKEMPKVNQIISVIIEPTILSYKIINTMKGRSIEGEYLTGKKLRVELNIRKNILYVADLNDQNVYLIENTYYQVAYITVPEYIEGTKLDLLVRYNKFKLKVDLNDFCYKLYSNSILITVFLNLQGYFKQTYQLCYSHYEQSNKTSNISICYNDASNNSIIIQNTACKNLAPKWSSTGKHIAFISNKTGNYMLYLYNIKNSHIKMLTPNEDFKVVSSFCWDHNGNIIFSAKAKSNKELFSLDIHNLTYKQLTYNLDNANSIKPLCSYINNSIGYIKHKNNSKDICILDINGHDNQQITIDSFIGDFDWSKDDNHIVYTNTNNNQDYIYIADVKTLSTKNIHMPNNIISIKKVLFTPNNDSITFIGNNDFTQDIYLYSLSNDKLKNLTNNNYPISIDDYTWDLEGLIIYFTADYQGFSNIYSLQKGTINRISNIIASKIKLDYRPKIL